MSDTASAPAKRGRKPADPEKPSEKGEAKKREHKKVEAENGDDEGVVTAKRGRGRPPKGTTSKKAEKPKAKPTGGRRGRPKKTQKNKDSEDDEKEKSSNTEEEEDEEEEEEEDDD